MVLCSLCNVWITDTKTMTRNFFRFYYKLVKFVELLSGNKKLSVSVAVDYQRNLYKSETIVGI